MHFVEIEFSLVGKLACKAGLVNTFPIVTDESTRRDHTVGFILPQQHQQQQLNKREWDYVTFHTRSTYETLPLNSISIVHKRCTHWNNDYSRADLFHISYLLIAQSDSPNTKAPKLFPSSRIQPSSIMTGSCIMSQRIILRSIVWVDTVRYPGQ